MNCGSLFAGIGGFDVAAERCGLTVAWQCEIDKHARKILEKHWPNTTRYEDITKINPASLAPIGVLCGGWPCQGNSSAGKRKGHVDPRSGLFSQILRLIDGMAEKPRWVFLENVPGLLSVNQRRDFAEVLLQLQGRGYVGCIRRLDAQFDGLAQRRQRLFFIAGLGAAGIRAVQLITEGGIRHPAPRREAREDVAASLTRGAGDGGGSYAGRRREDDVNLAAHARTITSREGLRYDESAETLIPFDTTQITSQANRCNPQAGDPCHPLASQAHPPAVAFSIRGRAGGSQAEVNEEGIANGLRTPGGGSSQQFLAGNGVRRLTPTEAERLQGFSWLVDGEWKDGHTCLCGRNNGRSLPAELACKCPDGPRYRTLGNAAPVPTLEWIFRQIIAAEQGS